MHALTIPFTGLKKQYHNLRQEILDATDQVLRSGQLMNGNFTAEFENWLAKKNHYPYAVTCHSGAVALEILARFYKRFLKFEETPIALIPSLTFVATANSFINAGWDVHFIDVDSNGILDIRNIPEDVDYDAIVIVGLYGASISRMYGSDEWFRDSRFNDAWLIEDGAQHWLSNNCARVSDTAISFDPMKNLPAYGNGGAIVTDNVVLAEWARSYRMHGINHCDSGSNVRMSELDCATMLVKTKHLDSWQKKRREIADFWISGFKKHDIRVILDPKTLESHAVHKFVIDVDNREKVSQKLADKLIETRVHYEHPLHELNKFHKYKGPGLLSKASMLSRRVLSLPIYPELTDLEVEYIMESVIKSVSG